MPDIIDDWPGDAPAEGAGCGPVRGTGVTVHEGPLALVRAASPLPLDPVDDHATCAERLGECHGLLLDMLRGMRPLAGGVRPRIERLLVEYGVIGSDEGRGEAA